VIDGGERLAGEFSRLDRARAGGDGRFAFLLEAAVAVLVGMRRRSRHDRDDKCQGKAFHDRAGARCRNSQSRTFT
jgi:hypothetical protein